MSERLQGGLKDRWEGMRSLWLERWLELERVAGSLLMRLMFGLYFLILSLSSVARILSND